jgi:hypothetical protein
MIELGADLEAQDKNGRNLLEAAMLRGDREAMNRLHAAGAKQPKPIESSDFRASMVKMADSIKHGVPMINVPDIAATLNWYTSIGFKEIGCNEDDGLVNWGMLSFGKAELMLNMHGTRGTHDVTLWFYTDQLDGPTGSFFAGHMPTAAQAVDKLENRFGLCFENGLHHQLAGRIQNGHRLGVIHEGAPCCRR